MGVSLALGVGRSGGSSGRSGVSSVCVLWALGASRGPSGFFARTLIGWLSFCVLRIVTIYSGLLG